MNGDGYSAATLDGRGRRYVHQHRESHSGLAPQTGTSGQVPWEYASHHSQHGHHHHQHHSGGRHSVPAPEPTSDVTSSYVRTLPHAHHHRSQGQLASEAYHVQHTPSRLQRLDGGLSLHQSATGPYGGVTPSYADPYGARLSQSSSSSSQNKQHGGQMTRSSTAADPYQWYKSGTLGRNSSRPTLRDIPIDTSAFVSQDAHPTAVVYPYRGQGATHQQAALAAAAAAAARYRSGAAAGYPMGYFAAEAPTQAHIATTPRRVSSDVYPRSPRHLGGRGNEQGLLSVAVPGTRAEQAALSQSLLRSVSSDKGPLSVHDIAAVAAQGEKQKIAVVKPIKQQASNNSHGGSGSDGRRNIDFHHGLGVGSGGTPHRTAASAPAQTQTSPWHQVAPQPSLASLGRELLTTTAGHHGPITSPRVVIQNPPSGKIAAIKRYIKKGTAAFFGVVEEGNVEEEDALKSRWLERRKRFSAKKFGELKDAFAAPCQREGEDDIDFWRRTRQRRDAADVSNVSATQRDGSDVLGIPTPQHPIPKPRKESVARLTIRGVSFLASAITSPRARENLNHGRGPIPKQFGRGWSRSFIKSSISGDDVSGDWTSRGVTGSNYYPPPPAGYRSADDSVDHPGAVEGEDSELAGLDDELFFDRSFADGEGDQPDVGENAKRGLNKKCERTSAGGWRRDRYVDEDDDGDFRPGSRNASRSSGGGFNRPTNALSTSGVKGVGMSRVWRRALDSVFDNSDRRQHGMGFVYRYIGGSWRKSGRRERRTPRDDMDDYRPYFTSWVTAVQILIMILSIICYGFGPLGFTIVEQRDLVRVTSLVKQSVDYWEPANFWIGPRASDLIHLGAKFAPCMRHDDRIYSQVEKQRIEEKDTACCIRNDNSGCVQASRRDCSWARGLGEELDTMSTWKKWSLMDAGPGGRVSGSVCGQDPNFCREPASVAPYEWPDDITKWPICRKRIGIVDRPGHAMGGTVDIKPDMLYSETLAVIARELQASEHMVCEVIGKPCCIGIHGDCRITTREYCAFVNGYFHEEAALCSQVSCLDDVCGMVPFYDRETPDQFYRLWTSLFLHAGLMHLGITVVIQWYVMRDLEKMAGPLRIGTIYVMSGVAGNLASAIFVPYRAEVGPAGSQFGLLACLFVEVINVWPMLRHPQTALYKLCAVTIGMFLLGLLPWVDNYAHVFGFVFGFLLSYALLPFVSFGPYDQRRKILLVWVFLVAVCLLFAILIILFYITPFYECEICKYLTCIPLVDDFCADQNINFDKKPFWSI